ncbi:DUF2917 domain-containing protein [Herbaspirillum sp. HC18]|nr:DUF2917 domain-containing protein [Herbaspirillum sp. HC18]
MRLTSESKIYRLDNRTASTRMILHGRKTTDSASLQRRPVGNSRSHIMRGLFTSKALNIPTGQTVSGIAERVHTLQIQRGRVWITVEGIKHDYFLHAGDTFTTVPGKLTVIEADQEASVSLCRPNAQRILHGIGKWMSAFAQRLPRRAVVQMSLKRNRPCDAC